MTTRIYIVGTQRRRGVIVCSVMEDLLLFMSRI